MERETHTIDAEGRILGRLATEIAVLLRGKNKPDFLPNLDAGGYVVVKNANKIIFSGKKRTKKKYIRHTEGYLGGEKELLLKNLFAKDPEEVIRRAVSGMLSNTKLKSDQIKRLKFE
jgi:large subunit ribosomal protein L13